MTLPSTFEVFTAFQVFNCNLTGNLDLSSLSNLGGSFKSNFNPNLTGITAPSTPQAFTAFESDNCDLTGNLDLSSLSGLGGNFSISNNPNLTGVTLPSTSEVFSLFITSGNDLTGNLDLSPLSGLGGTFISHANSGLTGVDLPTTYESFSLIQLYLCDLGYIDFTKIIGNSDNIVIRVDDNNMNVTQVNHILEDLDNIGWINGVLNIGGSNAAPDSSSGGYDGTTANANLIANGWTVTTS
jgi:hypothetical protein